MHDGLRRACEHAGIATHYHDVWGTYIEVPPPQLAALLGQFGIGPHAPEDDAAWDDALTRREDAAWRRALPPVQLAAAGAAALPVRVRLPEAQRQVDWRLVDEEGRLRGSGRADVDGAAETGRRTVDGVPHIEWQFEWPADLPMGYHRLSLAGHEGDMLVIAAPPRCHVPDSDVPEPSDARHWGIAVQLYALRSARQWGMGDFGDLAALAPTAARLGAQAIGLNPLHALFPDDPRKASPYSPSSRLHLNVLYIDVEAVEEFAHYEAARRHVASAPFQQRLAALRAAELIDHAGVAAAKLEVLAMLHARFAERRAQHGNALAAERARAFDAFRAARGEALQRHALFEALQAHFRAQDPDAWGWPAWPEPYRDPDAPAVQAFAQAHAPRVEFFAWLQWIADTQLHAAARRCREEGMAIGLYFDLAVSVDRYGADAWGAHAVLATQTSAGAPPDEFNPHGQDWGLPPFAPERLRESGYGLFIDSLRASMRGAGALRIDHVMGLVRLFCLPPGASPADGAYVHYPAEEMLAIVALESCRQQCMVIGEDLGTVADDTRRLLERYGLLSYRLLYFEREGEGFRAPGRYPRDALVAVSTHDLATLQGWWRSRDLHERIRLDLFPRPEIARQQLKDRAAERVQIAFALQDAGLLDAEAGAQALGSGLDAQAAAAVHAFLARTPSRLMMVQAEDLLGLQEQANMPGTVDTHPNWCRRLPAAVQDWPGHERVRRICAAVAGERPRPASPASGRPQACIPRATYRLQFHKDFGFDDAIAVLPYLARLGISHVYCSPIQRARPGSTHGYDVVAHGEINPELGGFEGFERFAHALRQHGMGQLLDLVPNHMGVLGADNPWWMDVLENGRASAYAGFFDIDWEPLDSDLRGKVLIPVLGEAYGVVLERGELALGFDAAAGSLSIRYHEHRFPLAPASYAQVLAWAEGLSDDADAAAELASAGYAFSRLPEGEAERETQLREKAIAHRRLAALVDAHPALAAAVRAAVEAWNRPRARDALHALLEAQHYRLAYWRVASDEINYRRFFDVNELAALRIERPEVFEATQGLALDLAAKGWVQGLRIDHPDGLRDPARYFERLQAGFARRTGRPLEGADAEGRPHRPLYVVAEKIAAGHEEVPSDWAIHGTTGYRFANLANGVFVDTRAAAAFARIWRGFTGRTQPFAEEAIASKRSVAANALASDMTTLASMLLRIARADRRTRDYTQGNLRRALAGVAACMSVYRTYVTTGASAQDRRFIEEAVATARARSELADASVFDFIRAALMAETPTQDEAVRRQVLHFAARFQQFSAPVAAKGVEDTAFYRWFPLASLNEVGGDPAQFGIGLAAFHAASADRAQRWPHTMLATSTHDNKRSEDVRARIDVLSEMPAAWRLALRRWKTINAPVRRRVATAHGGQQPSAADEYLLYQTLLGTWEDGAPTDAYADRIVAYMHKAAREAKLHTSWVQPHAGYEAALESFVRQVLGAQGHRAFVDDLRPLAASLAWYGGLNTLALAALKFTSVGVPDLYQGNELIDLSLVDPDNRRPIDYAGRSALLDALEALQAQGDDVGESVRALLAPQRLSEAKLWVVSRLLRLRVSHDAILRDGRHEALACDGPAANAVIAYRRAAPQGSVLAVTGRFFARQAAGHPPATWDAAPWAQTTVRPPPAAAWRDVLTGRRHEGEHLSVAQLLRDLPCAVLLGERIAPAE